MVIKVAAGTNMTVYLIRRGLSIPPVDLAIEHAYYIAYIVWLRIRRDRSIV